MQTEKDFSKDEKLALIVSELPTIKSEVLGIEVNSPETQAKAAGLVTKLKGYVKEIETRRKAWVAPFNDVLKVANNFAKAQKEPIEKLIGILTPALINYQDELARIARKKEMERLKEQERKDKELAALKAREAAAKIDKQQEKIQEKIEEAVNEPCAAPVKVENTVKTETGSVSFREVTKFEVTDINIVDRKYLALVDALVNRDIRAGVTEMKGIRIYKEKILAGRSA